MDSRTLSKATGVPAGTLNAWIQRGYVLGMDVEVSGKRRDFGVGQAIQLGIMAELTRSGIGAPLAATCAVQAMAEFTMSKNPKNAGGLFFQLHQEGPIGEVGQKFGFRFQPFESEAKIPEALEALALEALPEPSVYVVVNVARMGVKMQQAEAEWQRSRKAAAKRKSNG
jgi:hypothetical protein